MKGKKRMYGKKQIVLCFSKGFEIIVVIIVVAIRKIQINSKFVVVSREVE